MQLAGGLGEAMVTPQPFFSGPELRGLFERGLQPRPVAAAAEEPLEPELERLPEEARDDRPEMEFPAGQQDETFGAETTNPFDDQRAEPLEPEPRDEEDRRLSDPPPAAAAAAAAEGDESIRVTAEEYEQMSTTKHSQALMGILTEKFEAKDRKGPVSFQELAEGKTRATAAGLFFQLLVLANKNAIKVDQNEPFGDITVRPPLKKTKTKHSN